MEEDNRRKKSEAGVTVVELLLVLAIIALLFTKGSAVFAQTIASTKGVVCDLNIKIYTKEYNEFLVSRNIDHSDSVLRQFLEDAEKHPCPHKGDISYENNKLKCEYHRGEILEEVEEVPYI